MQLKQKAESPLRARILKNSDYHLPNRTRYSKSMVFTSIAEGNTSGLVGETNRFLLNIAHAECWFEVAQEQEEEEGMSLLHEFCDPLLELSVGRPYSLRNHFIFTAVHLLHQSGQLKNTKWKDDLPPDEKIGYKLLDRVASDWSQFPDFKAKLSSLNSKEFQNQTSNFRHRLQHQFRTHFGFGLTPIIEREKAEQGTVYHFKALRPLNLQTLFPILYKQQEIAVDLFHAYWDLVMELCEEWDGRYAVNDGT